MTADAGRREGGSLAWLTVLTLIGLAILIGLGVWQLQRLHWKEHLIATVTARETAEPVSLEEAIAREKRGEDVEFLRVRIQGRFEHANERRLYTVRGGAAGWSLITPLETAEGTTVLVDRGMVPVPLEDPATRSETQKPDAAEVTGLVRLSETPGIFTPDNDPERNRWYWRDVAGMARSISGAEAVDIAQFLIAAEPSDGPAALPRAEAGLPELSNRHLAYAVTWFGLAATLLTVYVAYILSRRR